MKFLSLVTCLLFLSACSQVSLGYRFADWAIEDRVDDYLDLSSNQKDILEKELDSYFAWNQKEMVPRYIAYLEGIKSAVAKKQYDESYWKILNKDLDQIYYDTALPFKKILSTIFVDMSKDQVAHLENEIVKLNAEKEKEYGRPLEERQDEKIEENVESFDKWFGNVSLDQKMMIQKATRDLKFPVESWLNKRKSQQQELLGLLKYEQATQKQYEDFLNTYIMRIPKKDTKLYYSEVDQFMVGFRKVFLDLLKTLDSRQLEHFDKRMNKIIKDLNKVHERGKAA